MTDPFRVGLTSSFRDANGQLAFGDIGLDLLDREPGLEYEFFTPNQPYVTPDQVARYDGIIALGGRYNAATLDGNRRLVAIGRFGVGYDTVDVDACTAADVALFITPDGVRRPVATSILALMLALGHKLVNKNSQTRAGNIDGLRRTIGTGLVGRVLGSVGMGNIGAELFRLAAPLGMQGMVYDPFIRPDVATELGVQMVDLDTLLQSADFLTVNCPLSAATHGLIGDAQLRRMKPTAYLINTARGPIVDTAALTSALRDGRLAGAGLDVTEPEPLPTDHPLLAMDNVIVTSHRLAWTDDMVLRTGQATMLGMCKLARGEPPDHVVNTHVLARPGFQARVRARRTDAVSPLHH